jgi:hypothetical protein
VQPNGNFEGGHNAQEGGIALGRPPSVCTFDVRHVTRTNHTYCSSAGRGSYCACLRQLFNLLKLFFQSPVDISGNRSSFVWQLTTEVTASPKYLSRRPFEQAVFKNLTTATFPAFSSEDIYRYFRRVSVDLVILLLVAFFEPSLFGDGFSGSSFI